MAKKKTQPGRVAADGGDRTPADSIAEANLRTSNHPDPEGTLTVRVKPDQAFEVGDMRYLEGMTFDLPTGAAKSAAESGAVEIVSPPERRKY